MSDTVTHLVAAHTDPHSKGMAQLLGRVLFGRRMAQGAMPALPGGDHLTLHTSESRALIGGSVWPLAAALCHHLLANRAALELEDGVDAIELGAGPGAVGLFAAALGAKCTLTEMQPARAATIPVSYSADGTLDLPEGRSACLIDLLHRNVEANIAHCRHKPETLCRFLPPQVLELDWNSASDLERAAARSPEQEGYGLVLASDVTYLSDLHPPLVRAIERLLRRGGENGAPPGVALIAHERRLTNLAGDDVQLDSFVAAATLVGLQVHVSELHVPQEGSTGALIRLSHVA